VPGTALLPGRRAAACAAALAALAIGLGGCGDTLQDRPIPHSTLETLLVAPFPVYWLGGSFEGLQITEASRDPSGAFSVQYGDCRRGGQGTCVPPVRVVTSPDNSFAPASASAHTLVAIRGIGVLSVQGGRTLVLPTGPVVVDIYALDPRLAAAAAHATVPINLAGNPGEALPAALPDSGYGRTPLAAQVPAPLAALR
jgi:hypothetical protein